MPSSPPLSSVSSPWLRIFLPFALGYYLSYLLRTVNAVISPALTGEFALGAGDLGLLTSLYFISFGLAQIPVGIALDRFGPRQVESLLLLLTALGAAVFASAESLTGLGLGRALIGLGVSACLMGALKGLTLWYPPERQGSMTSYIMACGALGALTASAPLEAVLPVLGWRQVFWLIAFVALAAALSLWLSLPRGETRSAGVSLRSIVSGLAVIFPSPAFLRFSGTAFFLVGGYMALQSLWAVPWLMEVEGLDLAATARVLFGFNAGMLCGQLVLGMIGVRLARRGIQPLQLLQVGYAGILLVELVILLGWGPSLPRWFLFGMLSAVNSQSYLAAAGSFSPQMFGRVSTSLNLLIFLGAFAVQWGIGLLLDMLRAAGWEMTPALQMTFGILLVVQVLSYLPLWWKLEARC